MKSIQSLFILLFFSYSFANLVLPQLLSPSLGASNGCASFGCNACDPTNRHCTQCGLQNLMLGLNTTDNTVWCIDVLAFLHCPRIDAIVPFSGCSNCTSRQGFEADFGESNLTACTSCRDSNCDNCQANYLMCAICHPGFFLTTNATCITKSDLGCTTTNVTGCTSCPSGRGLQANFSGTGLLGCAPCRDINCRDCSLDFNTCRACQPDYFINVLNNSCIASTSLNCVTTNSTGCATCNPGLGVIANFQSTGIFACVPCSDVHCIDCSTNLAICNACQANFFRNRLNNTCMSPDDIGCVTVNSTGCATCRPGQGVQINSQGTGISTCVNCQDSNCQLCTTNSAVCMACKQGTFLNTLSNTCITPTDLNCTTTNATGCATCPSGLGVKPNFQNTGISYCVACNDVHCSDCSQNYNLCMACQDSYLLITKNNTCIASTSLNCATTNSSGCASCNLGQGVKNNYQNTGLMGCVPCSDKHCTECSPNYLMCRTCQSDYLLNTVNNTCLAPSTLNCATSDHNGCATCNAGRGLQSNFANTSLVGCAPCKDVHCNSCSANFAVCTACQNNYFLNLLNFSCISSTDLGCNTTNSTGCATCTIGQGVQPNFQGTTLLGCVPCSVSHCGNCSTNFAVCDTCQGNYFLIASNNTCISGAAFNCSTHNSTGCETCPLGYGVIANYNSTGINGCTACRDANCGNCSTNYEVCSACMPNTFYNAKDHICLSRMDLGCFTVNSTGCASCMVGMGPAENWRNTSITGCEWCDVSACSVCRDNYLLCDGCKEGFFRPLIDNTTGISEIDRRHCQETSIFNCGTVRDGIGCDTCAMGTGFNYNFSNTAYRACAPCQADCVDCRDNAAECTTCNDTFVTYTVNGRVAGCYPCRNLSCPIVWDVPQYCVNNEGCQSCVAGTYMSKASGIDLTMCKDCPEGCTGCTSVNQCTMCKEDWSLKNVIQNGTSAQICVPNGAARIGMGILALVFMVLMIIF